ncbi:MAG TPA: hypothetical protein VIM57_04350, partial [Luteolibacter sp.]
MDGLRERLLEQMNGTAEAVPFDSLALEVFAYQFKRNAAYRNYAIARGRTPETVVHWRDIPAIPTDAFKLPRFPLRTFPESETVKVFRTSGTTRDVRGAHAFNDLVLYETSILRGWEHAGLPAPANPWFLSQSPAAAPDSSLVHMFETLHHTYASGEEGRWLIDGQGRFQTNRLREIASSGEPVALFATALALLRWTESNPPLALPQGSWIFETGGYKGVSITLDKAAFQQQVAAHFFIPVDRLLNEYGMTELSSPFYAWAGETAHRGSPWTRIRVIAPETGETSDDGSPGYLEILD